MSWSIMSKSRADGGLGFWEYTCFNKAILAKQTKKHIQYLNSLLFLIMEAKCYQYGDFLKVGLGTRPSYVCRNIHGAKHLLNEG